MGKESKYTFAKLFAAKNDKKCARKMIFDSTIIQPVSLAVKKKRPTVTVSEETKQKIQDKVNFWTKDNLHTLKTMH